MDVLFTMTKGDFSLSLILILFDPFRIIYLYNGGILALGINSVSSWVKFRQFLTIILNINMFFAKAFNAYIMIRAKREWSSVRAKQHEALCSVMWLNAQFTTSET